MKTGFEIEFYQIPNHQRKEAKQKLMEALKVKTRQSFWKHKKGKVEMKASQYFAAQEVFNEYGIKY